MSTEEQAIVAAGMVSVGSKSDSISNELLDAALGVQALKQKVSLTFEGINLPNMDVGSKTDAFCVLFFMNNGRKTKIGETEVIPDNLNPKWVSNITVDYYFET